MATCRACIVSILLNTLKDSGCISYCVASSDYTISYVSDLETSVATFNLVVERLVQSDFWEMLSLTTQMPHD